MNLFTLECPHCKATLDVEDGLDTFYCKYCGAKLIVESMSDDSLNARVRLKEMEHEERLQDAEYEYKRFKMLHKAKEERSNTRFAFIILGLMALPCILYFGGVSCSHNMHVSDLERIEASIQSDIMAGDYDSALIKTNQLRLDDHYSNEQTQSWDKKREMYIDIINEKKRESDANNPDNVYAPKSSKAFGDLTGEEAKAAFEAAGFTNIELIQVDGSAGWFRKANLVEHINFAGKTDFTTEDYCKKDSRITIYYFAE